MIIKDCSCGKRCMAGMDKCASCLAIDRKSARVKASDSTSPINRVSARRGKYEQRYFARLKTWKRGKKCAATFPHECSSEITCHHMMNRSIDQFHDEWAAENDLPYLNDERLWMPLCPNAHAYVTEHSKFAWENGYSFKRVSDPLFQVTRH